MSKKVLIAVDEDAMKKLDDLIHSFYADRCHLRNFPEAGFEEFDYNSILYYHSKAKEVARAFGLYPYNQEEVKYPETQRYKVEGYDD